MIAAIFVVPLIYFINAFLIGRLLKKWSISINTFLASIIGFVAFFDVIYFISIWLYAGKASVWSYYVVLGVFQGLLIAFYLANWRRTFLTWSFSLRKVLTFVIVFGLVIIIGWLNFRSYNSEFGKNWIWAIEHTQLDIWKPMWFGKTPNDIVSNFSAFNVMNCFWMVPFNIIKKVDGLTFCGWSWTIIAAGMIACLTLWMINDGFSIKKLIGCSIINLVFVTMILAFIESFAIGDAWVLLLLYAYILVIVKQKSYSPIKLFALTTILIGFLAASCASFFTVICVWIFSIYYIIRNKQNSINYALFLTWPLSLTIFSLLSIYTFWLLSLMDALYIVFVIILIGIYAKVGTPVWDTKIAMSVYKNSGKIVYTGLAILVALILISNFFIFQEIYRWNGKNIDYKNFLTFTYTYLWTINITSNVAVGVFNAVMYVLFVALTITYIVIRTKKNNKLNPLFRTDGALKLSVISCILFINPLVIHMIKISTVIYPLNALDLNMLFVVPIFVLCLKINANHKLSPLAKWQYAWY